MLGLLLCGSSLCLTACPGDDGPSGDATDGTTSTGSTGSTSTGEPPTSASSSDSTAAATSSDTGPGTGTMDDTSSGGSVGSETGPTTCDFASTLEMLAQGKTDPIDCGSATLEDDVATWEMVSDCAAQAAGNQEAFTAAFQLPSIDSTVYDGFYGLVGIVYSAGRLHYDDLGEPVLGLQSCAEVDTVPGCQVDVGEHCLECVDAGEISEIECVMQ
jgi:hypothetical protein